MAITNNTKGLVVNIDVPDLKAGIAFYEQGLGLKFQRTLFDRTVAELAGGSMLVYLIEQAAGTHPVPNSGIVREYGQHWTPVHLDILVDDIHSALTRARAAGATASGEVCAYAWGKCASLRDPFGHGVCLLEFAGDGYAAVADSPT